MEFKIRGVLSDACTLSTCCVTNADTLTVLCREGDVEANDSFRRLFTPSCNFQKCRLKFDVVSAFSLVQDYDTFICERLLSTLVANVARVALSLTYFGWCASFSAQNWTSGIHLILGNGNHRNSRSKSGICCRVRPNFLRVGPVVSACTFPRPFVAVDYNQLHSKEVEHRFRNVSSFPADKRVDVS